MILTCPNCATRYTVADGAIPPGGRQVRCASCKHRWHQDPETLEGQALDIGANPRDVSPPDTDSHLAGDAGGKPDPSWGGTHAHPDTAPSPDDYRADPDASPLPNPSPSTPPASTMSENGGQSDLSAARRFAATMPEQHASAADEHTDYDPEFVVPAPAAADDRAWGNDPAKQADAAPGQLDRDDYYTDVQDYDEPAERSRLPLIIGGGLLLIALIAAALWFLAPTAVRQRLGLATASADTPLMLQIEQHNRQPLASGNQLYEVSGRVINPTDTEQQVPPLQAELRSLEQKVVYKWTIPPPARRLAAGASATFNSTELDIPPAAVCISMWFDSPRQPPRQPCRSANGTRAS